MLYGHLESMEDRINHLAYLRDLQDETGGFTGFIPLAYQPSKNQENVGSKLCYFYPNKACHAMNCDSLKM